MKKNTTWSFIFILLCVVNIHTMTGMHKIAPLIPLAASSYEFLGRTLSLYNSSILLKNMTKTDDWIGKEVKEEEEQQMEAFVRHELQASKINVKGCDFVASEGALFNTILISLDGREKFIKAGILKAPLETKYLGYGDKQIIKEKWHTVDWDEAEKITQELKAMLHHEYGHIKARDWERYLFASSALFSMNGASLALLNKFLKHSGYSKKISTGITLFSALPFYITNRLLMIAYSRKRESIADEQIPDKREYLEGAISMFEKQVEKEHVGPQKSFLSDKIGYLWRSTHPRTQDRVMRFKERLENLKSK